MHTAWRKFDVNCGPRSVSIVDEILKFDIFWSINIIAVTVAVLRTVGTAFVSFENRPVTTTINWLSDLAFENRPSMSMTTYCRCPKGRKQMRLRSFVVSLAVWGPVTTIANCCVDFACNVPPVQIPVHCVVSRTFA